MLVIDVKVVMVIIVVIAVMLNIVVVIAEHCYEGEKELFMLKW